ncbi:MAG: NAD(P)/FAD-dependent oxidoreductase [Candidatus Micrarchaeota archaeon]
MTDAFDVLIIGAGPAGGNAGRNAAELGLKTAILEEHKTVGEPVHCGECLSQLALERQNLKIPDKAISIPVKGVRVIFPNEKSCTVTEPGFVLEKHLFEQWLANEAQKKGAELLLDHKALDLKRENGLWKIQTNHGELSAKIVIDASGIQSIASRKLGLNRRFESVIGIQHEIREIPSDDYLDFFLWPEFAPQGYCWSIPKSHNRANVGLVTGQKNRAKEFCDAFVKRRKWENKTIVKTFGGLIPSSGPLPKTYFDGLMLIGDAAGFTSPLFEGGTHLGLASGNFAAQVAAKAIGKNNWGSGALWEYEQLWKKEFPAYHSLMKGKKALYDFSGEELNQMALLLPKEIGNMGVADYASVGLKLFGKYPRLVSKGIMDAFQAFKYSRAKYYGW